MLLLSIMIIGILIILGLSMGSFVNALVWRLHEQEKPKKKRAASDAELSIVSGRSMCPHCKHTLAWYDLLPVVSWLSVLGKCRYCHKSISWQYPLVELATAVLFVISYAFWPSDLNTTLATIPFITWLIALVGLVALTVYDIKWMLLPNRVVFPLLGLAISSVVMQSIFSPGPLTLILNAFGGLAVAGGIFYVLFQVSNGKWIGGGDVKLGFVLGLLLAKPVLGFLMLFVASILGLIVSVPTLFTRKLQLSSRIPFGPFLIMATIIVMLSGQTIIDWYSSTFLYL